MKAHFNFEDLSQTFVGAFALAVPISFSEEAWNIGPSLPLLNLLLIFSLSVLFLAFFTYESVFRGDVKHRIGAFFFRLLVAYTIASLVVALLLFALDKFPLILAPEVAIKRLIVITMPASMGAIVVDSFDKE